MISAQVGVLLTVNLVLFYDTDFFVCLVQVDSLRNAIFLGHLLKFEQVAVLGNFFLGSLVDAELLRYHADTFIGDLVVMQKPVKVSFFAY